MSYRTWVQVSAGLFALVLLIGATSSLLVLRNGETKAALRIQGPVPDPSSKHKTFAPPDFALRLGSGQREHAVLLALNDAALSRRVLLSRVQINEHRPPQGHSLGCIRLSAELRGNYVDIKRVLLDVLDRQQGIGVERMALHRTVGLDNSVDAVVSLSAWSAPVAQ